LSSLPPEIGSLANLWNLDLYSNQLTSLPPEFTNLSNLSGLWLTANQLTSLPAEFFNLTNLSNLRLDSNQLTNLPPGLSDLQNLYELGLSGNQLTSLPAEFGSLTGLEILYLHGNQISDISPLINLTNLSELNLQNNPLNATAYSIFLPQIQVNNPGINLIYDPQLTTYSLIIYSSGVTSVPISSSTGHSGVTNYTKTVNEDTTVTLTAPVLSEKDFTGWTGSVNSSSQTITLSMTANKSVTANYNTTDPETVTVPTVVGIAQASAGAIISSSNLVVGEVTYRFNETASQGDVISQTPTAGSSVPFGSSVDLVVSLGERPDSDINEGCTPRFWRTNPGCWCDAYSPELQVSVVFTAIQSPIYADYADEKCDFDADTLLAALNYRGGRGLEGSVRNLLRHATASLLNICNDNVNYPVWEALIIDLTNAVLATEDTDFIQELHSVLAEFNEYGCPIDVSCEPIAQ